MSSALKPGCQTSVISGNFISGSPASSDVSFDSKGPLRGPILAVGNIPATSQGTFHTGQGQPQSLHLPHNGTTQIDFSTSSFHMPYGATDQGNLYMFPSENPFSSSSPSSLSNKDPLKLEGNLRSSQNLDSKLFSSAKIKSNDKLISGFDGRIDRLSPISVISVAGFQDLSRGGTGSPSSGVTAGNALNLTKEQLRSFQSCGGDAMLSAINYSENDVLQEGGFEISASSGFNSLDGLLGTNSGGSIRLPDLLDADVSQEGYIENEHDLQLSPQAFSAGADSFSDGTHLNSINDNSTMELSLQDETRSQPEVSSVTCSSDKSKLKSSIGRPLKACSPGRPGNQPCPTCGKVFSNSSALTKHKLTHSDERKYVCQLCAKAFKRQDHLNGHMLTHRNKKPFECDMDGCGKSYCDARSLRRHKENHHSSSCLSSSNAVGSVPSGTGQTVTVIPGIPHLSFNSLQTAFAASGILTNGTTTLADSTKGNRIQYAPPAGFAQDAAVAQLLNSVLPSAASQLQFLAFQQHPTPSSHQKTPQATTDMKPEKLPILPQTLNSSLIVTNFQTPTTLVQPKEERAPTPQPDDSEGNGLIMPPADVSPSNDTPILEEEEIDEGEFEEDNGNKAPPADGFVSSTTSFQKQDNCSLGPPDLPSIADYTASLDSEGSELFPTIKKECEEMGSGGEEPRSETPLLQQLLAPMGQRNCPGQAGTALGDNLHNRMLSSEPWEQLSSCLSDYNSSSHSFEPKQVECSLCQRKFKNIPALNGHMRLHGGYFKKEGDCKKSEQRASATGGESSSPVSQTASVNVRALIEERIIQRRSAAQQQQASASSASSSLFSTEASYTLSIPDQPGLEPTAVPFQEQPDLNQDMQPSSSPLLPTNNLFGSFDFSNSVGSSVQIKQQFRVPRPVAEKHRRHSDSDHFLPNSRPCTETITSALADFLRRKGVAKRNSRTGSDPEELQPCVQLKPPSQSESLPSTPTFYQWNQAPFSPAVPLAAPSLQPPGGSHFSFLEKDLLFSSPLSKPVFPQNPEQHEKECDSLMDVTSFSAADLLAPEAELADICNLGQTSMSESTIESRGKFIQGTEEVDQIECSAFKEEPKDDKSSASAAAAVGYLVTEDADDDVFLSPTVLSTSPSKVKRKHRPEPLFIPPHVSTSGFTSRLRSPRLWDPSLPSVLGGPGGVEAGKQSLSPPPYTPPPMLSPVRTGSGLFWHIISGASGNVTPKSAPITPSFLLKKSTGSASEDLLEEEEEYFDTPETDIQPHVNIGPQFQARLPRCRSSYRQEAVLLQDKADPIWDPTVLEGIPDEEVDSYLEFACCAAVPGGGRNKEYALHILQLTGGNIQEAILRLMEPEPHLPQGHPLLNYQYSETDMWTVEELETYHQALIKCDKDFFSLSKEVSGKSVKQCVQFYYLWKKVCPEEYKRMRLIRHKKEQESIFYNLRSKVPMDNCLDSSNEEAAPELEAVPEMSNGYYPDIGSAVPSPSSTTTLKVAPAQEPDVFPCKICGKVFTKVKSRNAHMKSHRQTEDRRAYAQSFFHLPNH